MPSSSSSHEAASASARQHMVDSQLAPNKVIASGIKAAMGAVPRERFLPAAYAGVAYIDEDIPCGPGRFIMEPMVFARLLQAAEIGPGDVVLDVGCASGYSVAVLSRLAGTVVGVEQDKTLVAKAADVLTGLGIDNAAVVAGSLEGGLPDQGPFSVIVVEGSVDSVPEALLVQLAPGGRLVAVVRDDGGVGRARIWRRIESGFSENFLFDASIPRLPGFERGKAFVF